MSNEVVYIPTESILSVSIGKGSKTTLARRTNSNKGLPKLTAQEVAEWFVTLQDAKEVLSIAHLAYVRRLVKDNKLEGIKVAVPGGSRWLVTKESIEGYSTRTIRSRELRNYILRIPSDQEAAVRKLLMQNGIKYNLELAYVAKEKTTKKGESLWATLIAKLEE